MQEEEIQLKYSKIEDLQADIFTKRLPREKFNYLREMLAVIQGIKGVLK